MSDTTAVLGPGTLGRDLPRGRHERERFPIVSLPLDTALNTEVDLPRPRHAALKEEVAFFEKVREGREAIREG